MDLETMSKAELLSEVKRLQELVAEMRQLLEQKKIVYSRQRRQKYAWFGNDYAGR